jgi:ubiquinone biosynthesis protein
VSVFAKHGFQDLAERIKLATPSLGKLVPGDTSNLSIPERLCVCFEELGPAFVKLGQLLATRPDLIPGDYADEFKRLHDHVKPLPFSEIETVLTEHFGNDWRSVFSDFNQELLGAASIGQVHMARLTTGEKVVVKVQRPGIATVIEDDLNVLYTLAELLEKYVQELRLYNVVGIVDEFARSLELETNFIIEANNIRRFKENFVNEPNIRIPEVYTALSGRRVLVMEAFEGIPLSQKNALNQEGINPEEVLKVGLRCYLKMVFSDGLFHGDLHAGNMFVLPNNKIGLIDFGVVGRLNQKTQSAIANMLLALASEDYDRLAYEYVDLAPFTEGVDVDLFARDLRDLIAPYYGLTLKHVNVGSLLLESAGLAARYRLRLPTELIMFFKSIVTIEGMGRVISKDFNFLMYSIEFASELVKTRTEPGKLLRDLSGLGRDMNVLVTNLPRQLRILFRRLVGPEFAVKLDVRGFEDLIRVERKSGRMIALAIVAGALILAGTTVLQNPVGPLLFGVPALAAAHYGIAILIVLTVLW